MAEKYLRTMDVAKRIKKRYQKARDLMLSGEFGDITEDEDGKTVVTESGVAAWEARQSAPTASRKP